MALHVLDVAVRDVAAGALGLLLDAPAPPALAELELRSGDDRLVLGVLGSSHVVTATTRGRTCVEQVSCDAGAAGGELLPRVRMAGGHSLRSTTTTLAAHQVAALAEQLRACAGQQPHWLAGAFPGARAAVTALVGRALPGGWGWRTWHLYPAAGRGVVVRTSSRWTP